MIRKKYKALNTIRFWATLIIGFIIAILIVQPVAISIFMYDSPSGLMGWWQTFKTVLVQIIKMEDAEQLLKNFLFGVMGVSISVMYYIGLNMRKDKNL